MPDSPPAALAVASRKGKEREQAQSIDLAGRIFSLQRSKAAASTKPRERAERPQISSATTARPTARQPSPRRMHAPPATASAPSIVVSQPPSSRMDAVPDEFSRRLKISATSPRPSHAKAQDASGSPKGKLWNPNTDPIRKPQVLVAEPDTISDAASSSYAPRGHTSRANAHPHPSRGPVDSNRQLFDHRRDDPVRFAVLTRPHVSPNSAHAAVVTSNGRPTPTPKSSGEYVSASSTSSASYAQSTISSNFTLSSSTTDNSSTPSAIFDNARADGRRSEDSGSGVNALSARLKQLYRNITALESTLEKKLLAEDKNLDDDRDREGAPRVGLLVKGRPGSTAAEVKGGEEEAERDRWQRLVKEHKQLADMMHQMLQLTFGPYVAGSLRDIPRKYHLITRLWLHGFHRLLESLRRAAMPPSNSAIALEYLQDFMVYTYTFYGALLEEERLEAFRGDWLEALGDVSRYFMAVTVITDSARLSPRAITITTPKPSALAHHHLMANTPRPSTPNMSSMADMQDTPSSNPAQLTRFARIDDSPPSSEAQRPGPGAAPSVGVVAARMMELEPDKERWRSVAKGWFARGLARSPGAGKLHHHLGLLSRDKDGGEEDLRAVYHFIKGMIARNPFTTSRESILPVWSAPAQARRLAPDARLTDIFVLLHGMLFTNIQLDDFKPLLERFEEKLQIEGGEVIEERDWIMMAIVNIGAILEYGRSTAALRRVAGLMDASAPNGAAAAAAKIKLMAKKPLADDKKMDVDEQEGDAEGADDAKPSATRATASNGSPMLMDASPTPSKPAELELPPALKLSMQLTFAMLIQALRAPERRTSIVTRSTINPYITITLTFLATVLKDRQALRALERAIPWQELAEFLNTIPRRVTSREHQKEQSDGGMMLTSGSKPLAEDWCLRGLGWGAKKIYEHGFWDRERANASTDEYNVEVEVLDSMEGDAAMEGLIENDNEGEEAQPQRSGVSRDVTRRWVRIARAGLKIAKYVDGFDYIPAAAPEEKGTWCVEGALAEKVGKWREEERLEREAEERRLRGTRWDDESMDVDDDGELGADGDSDDSEDDEDDPAEIKALKARRRYLRSLLQASQRSISPTQSRRTGRAATRKAAAIRQSVHAVPGYTVLVFDTNILLSSLTMFASLVESLRWTIVVPLPVIMELDGLKSNVSPLGEAALIALNYVTSHIRSHSSSLKVLTSKGNYLTTLTVRAEQVDFTENETSWERNMDDLILRAAMWQEEHWTDRSALLRTDDCARDTAGAAKVVLLSFDRNLRLKARSRQLNVANERDLATILAAAP
ncbi:hypothetical protein OBBRIDRAFT_767535 [Obba rivulosa]|uniref:PIN domain-containing protein n=1 Tax=Obba rivulosa TaxID=1052685 RepID=A0A8E2J661_9APHY|nr:hypothetical protein OBBRIDRAFT_767535 [Obba rivulosa]